MCSARAVRSRGAPPQRSIPKSPDLRSPSRPLLCMGHALNLGNNQNRALASLAGAWGVEMFSSRRGVHEKPTQHAAAAAVLFVRHHHGIGGVTTDERHSSAGPASLSLAFSQRSRTSSNQFGETTGPSHAARGGRGRWSHDNTHGQRGGRYRRKRLLALP